MTATDILFSIAIIPVVIILFYVYTKDKNKEPKQLLVKLFISGIISALLVIFITRIIETFFPIIGQDTNTLNVIELLIVAFLGVALLEEICKWLMTYSIGYNNKEFDEFFDGIVYAVFVALGFAAIENILYVLGTNNIAVGIARGLLSIPGHACFGLYMGYYLSKAKLSSKEGKKDKEKIYLILSILIPMILHGIYDYCLFVGNIIFLVIFLLFVISLFIYSIIKIKKSAKNLTRLRNEKNYCIHCGNHLNGPYCNNCGRKQD